MSPMRQRDQLRRALMYGVIGLQLLLLSAIVAFQEVNRSFDSSIPVELEIFQAQAQKDPFRGASVSGRAALDFEAGKAALPPGSLQPGEKVLVFFTIGAGRQHKISHVERRSWGRDPAFSAERFTIPGRVWKGDRTRSIYSGRRTLVARIGTPPVSIELDLPATISIDDSLLEQFSRPSVVRANLRQGYLGYRYFDQVRLTGEGWTAQMSFAYDEARDRLIIFAPEPVSLERRRRLDEQAVRTKVFFFDGMGKELRSAEVVGRIVDGVKNPADETFWVLMATDPWGYSKVQLARVGADGTILRRGPQIDYQQIVGFDGREGSLWVLASLSPARGTPYFVRRMTLEGFKEPRLGPFLSRPQGLFTEGEWIWVAEPEQHRVTGFDRTGRAALEYLDLNRPTEVAADAGFLFVVEAAQTQLSKFSIDGKPVWRVPRFHGLNWILPEPGSGGGWVGAQRFENLEGGIFRYNAEGKISRPSDVDIFQGIRAGLERPRFAREVVRAGTHGRFYVREGQAVLILSPDLTVLKRVEGFRHATEQPLRQ